MMTIWGCSLLVLMSNPHFGRLYEYFKRKRWVGKVRPKWRLFYGLLYYVLDEKRWSLWPFGALKCLWVDICGYDMFKKLALPNVTFILGWYYKMIGPNDLLLVVSHLFYNPDFPIYCWVLGNCKEAILNVRGIDWNPNTRYGWSCSKPRQT
jgi:hypothetical protein